MDSISSLIELHMTSHDSISEMKWNPADQTLSYIEKTGRESRIGSLDWKTKARHIVSTPNLPAFGPSINYGGGSYCIDQHQVILCGQDKRLYRLDRASSTITTISQTYPGIVLGNLSPCGEYVAFAAQTGDKCQIWLTSTKPQPDDQQISKNGRFAWNPTFSRCGTKLTWYAWDHNQMPWDGGYIQIATCKSNWSETIKGIATLSHQEGAAKNPVFSPSGNLIAYRSDHQGFDKLFVSDLQGNIQWSWAPSKNGECGVPDWAPMNFPVQWGADDQTLFVEWTAQGSQTLYKVQLKNQAASAKQIFADPDSTFTGWTSCGNQVSICTSSTSHPGKWLYTSDRGEKSHLLLDTSRGNLLAHKLPKTQPVEWQSSPDVTTYGRIFYSKDLKNPRPTIVHLHGGPTGQQMTHYNTSINIFTSSGYNVFAIDYRGSSGYGKAYRDDLRGKWGIADYEDTISGLQSLIERGYIDPDKVFLSGGSAGGLIAYQCLMYAPKMWAGAIIRYGVADPFELKQNEHFFEKGYGLSLIGKEEECATHYERVNAVKNAHLIKAPVLLFHGTDDNVVPLSHSEKIYSALQNQDAELVVYEEEGHIFLKRRHNVDYFTRCLAFLDRLSGE